MDRKYRFLACDKGMLCLEEVNVVDAPKLPYQFLESKIHKLFYFLRTLEIVGQQISPTIVNCVFELFFTLSIMEYLK